MGLSDGSATLEGRVALVTGGTRGLGREMVTAFAQAGADVVIASRKQHACDEVAREVRAATGRRAFAHACHVGSWSDVESLVDAAYSEFGAVDVLVNNAGHRAAVPEPRRGQRGTVRQGDRRQLEGSVPAGRARSGRAWRRATAGRSSTSAASPRSGPRPTTCPTPRPRRASTRSPQDSRRRTGRRCASTRSWPVRSSPTSPTAWDLDAFSDRAKTYALGRGGAPHEIVGAALYLAGDASSFVTGSVLRVDGGMAIAR